MFRPNLVFLYPTDEVLFAKGVAFFLMERLNYPLKKITFSTFEQFNEFEVDSKSWIVAMGKYAHLYPYINSLDSNSLNRILLLTHSYLPLSKKELRHHPFKGIWYVHDINIKNIKGLRRPPNNKFLPRNLESEHIMKKIQLEKGLIQASSFDEWEENLINLYPNLSNEIQNIFNRY